MVHGRSRDDRFFVHMVGPDTPRSVVVTLGCPQGGSPHHSISLAILATAVIFGTVFAYLGAVLMVLGFYIKARLEERFLREELGTEVYDAYARRIPMLVPFLRI